MRCALFVALILAAASAARQPDAEGCKWSWKAGGCTPADKCRLHFAPRIGTLGPCVLRGASAKGGAAAEPATDPEPAAAADEPPPAGEVPPAAEPAPADAEPAEAHAEL